MRFRRSIFNRGPVADPLGQKRLRYEIESTEKHTLTRRYLHDDEAVALREKGYTVTLLDGELREIEDNQERLAKSKLAKDGTVRVGGNPFARPSKKWCGDLSTTPASFHSHVAVRERKPNGKVLTFRFPRQNFVNKDQM